MSFKRVSEYYDILEKLCSLKYVEVRKLLDDFPNRSQSGIYNILERFVDEGLIIKRELEETTVGKKRTDYKISGAGKNVLKKRFDNLRKVLKINDLNANHQKLSILKKEVKLDDHSENKAERINNFIFEISDEILDAVNDNNKLKKVQNLLIKELINF